VIIRAFFYFFLYLSTYFISKRVNLNYQEQASPSPFNHNVFEFLNLTTCLTVEFLIDCASTHQALFSINAQQSFFHLKEVGKVNPTQKGVGWALPALQKILLNLVSCFLEITLSESYI
jgi:hypothetical protein